jgi:senataxin
LDINTVDGYQGKEKEIIMLSTVRSHEGRGVGFLADIRRMNVALTRAKYSMWIVGNSRSLIQNTHWRDLIDFAKEIHQCPS